MSETLLPPELGESFRETWLEWCQYRREIRKPVTETAANRQLKKLAAWGPDQAAASIDQSISNTWTGLFEPKDNGKPGRTEPVDNEPIGPSGRTRRF